jgi:hypothetical protein
VHAEIQTHHISVPASKETCLRLDKKADSIWIKITVYLCGKNEELVLIL